MRTYGDIALSPPGDGRWWEIANLEPHVAIMFKRLFPRVPATATKIRLSDTDQMRADLHWFMQRYPLRPHFEDGFTIAAELRAGKNRIAHRQIERDLILLPDWTPPETKGWKDGKRPFVYQQQAARIALANGALLLVDDAGLGKTISAAASLLDGAPLPAAVFCDAHLCRQWKAKLEEFTHLSVHIADTRTPYTLPAADVVVFSWAKSIGWADIFKTGYFKSVVWDEIQELRTGEGKPGQPVRKGEVAAIVADQAAVRLGLTATPIYNYGDEIHAIMRFIKPDLLGDEYEFLREWCGQGRQVKDPDALGTYLRDTGYFLRRDEDDPSVQMAWKQALPPLNTLDFEVDYDDADVKEEEALARKLALQVLNSSFVEAGQAARELDMRMRQLTGIAKARSVAAYVRMLLMDSERVLLAGWHREVYSIWQQELARFNPVFYTGSETAAGKQRSIEAFTQGDSRVMFMSLRSGKGVDGLQGHCCEAVVGEFDWSPQVHYQFFRRLRRPGMDPAKPVTGHYLHTSFGSDPVLMEMLGVKADQSRGINDPGRAMKPRLSDDARIKRLAHYVLTGETVQAGEAA
jgi:hypothetical protein